MNMNEINEVSRKRKSNHQEPEPQPKRKKNDEGVDTQKKEIKSCPICLRSTKNKLIGSPDKCSHSFCLRCLKRWSKENNTCPVCRTKYKIMEVHRKYTRRCIKQIAVTVKKPAQEDTDDEEEHSPFLALLPRMFINLLRNLFVVSQE